MLKTYWLIGFCLFFSLSLIAQQYNFKNFSFEEGLTESKVSAIVEDQQGNLWIGTIGGGLFKYDGYAFTSFLDEDGLINNFVHSIYSDPSGKLWIGTEAGICFYDGNRFHYSPDFDTLKNQKIKAIAGGVDSKSLWFGTEEDGLYEWKEGVFLKYGREQNLPDKQVNCLYMDGKNTLWVGTPKGVMSLDDQQIVTYSTKEGLAANYIRAITEDKEGSIWLGTAGRGLSKFDGSKFSTYTTFHGLPSNQVHALFTDRRGNLWAGTARGIGKYKAGTFVSFNENVIQTKKVIVDIYEDRTGNLWFGTADRGIDRLDSERFIHYIENDEMGKRIYAVNQALSGDMIYASSRGSITTFNGKRYSLLKGLSGFPKSEVRSLFYAPDSTLWMGTSEEGAFQFNQRNFSNFTIEEGLKSNDISGFAVDKLGNTWIASADSGVSVLQLVDDSVQTIYNYNQSNGLSDLVINAISSDADGNIWIGTENGGLDKLTINSPPDSTRLPVTHYTVQEGLSSNAIQCILTDSRQHVFVGTAGGGINILRNNEWKQITKTDGLTSNNIYSLVFDEAGNLWAGTERGVERIAFGPGFSVDNIRHYGPNEGFKGIEVYRNASYRDNEGNIWFGTVNGVIKYNPKEDEELKAIPKIQLTGIKLFFEDIQETSYADSAATNFPIPDKLILPFDQNNLSFEFSGTYLRNPSAVRYKWKLEGYDEQWSPPLARREATFSNLPPGNYVFKVEAGNEYDLWNETPATFSFQIQQPPWEEWWVRPTVILILGLIVSLIIYQRFRRIKAKNKIEKERLEMEKNLIELEQEASRLQMNPHFIFNSLNSIQGFIATNDPFQAKRYLAKFARLMRLILENAREEYIPLENELDILENYMELEKLSTNNKFEFSINIHEDIIADNTEIPPMMIQPFVENAIIHGIKKKEGKGAIELDFSLDGQLIVCKITDDGVGRHAKGPTKNGAKKKHKSAGISVTKKRLEQLKIQTGLEVGIYINDLIEEGQPKGTQVVIHMPYESY